MNIDVLELGLVGRETKGNPDHASPLAETMPKHWSRSYDDDDGM